MVRVYDERRRQTAVLENAKNVKESVRINAISTLSFALPENDHKNRHCKPFAYVNYDEGQLYRIMPTRIELDELGNIIYTCEHVIATLIDKVMFGHHVIGNVGTNTTAVLRWLLERQNRRYDPWTRVWAMDSQKRVDWILGDVEINRQFEYAWEQESILYALWSVATPFTEPYMWEFDTSVYPFRIHLRRLSADISKALFIRKGKNLIKLVKSGDPTLLCTRLYPLGQSEGTYQVNIRDVNRGVPFIQSPQAITDKRGIIERIWTDRRYTNPRSLLEAGQAILSESQELYEEYSVDMAMLDDVDVFTPWIGRLVRVEDADLTTWIVGVETSYDEVPVTKVLIANKVRDIAGSIANLADRQRIESAHGQGSSQIFERDASDNCDTPAPLLLKIFIPAGLEKIKHVLLDVEMSQFRLPFAVTQGGGARSETSGASSRNTTANGGASTQTSASGGGGAQTSSASGAGTPTSGPSTRHTTVGGGGFQAASTSGGVAALNAPAIRESATTTGTTGATAHSHTFQRMRVDHRHSVTLGAHTHQMDHTHTVSIGNHNHSVSIPGHSHSVSIPNHSHDMAHTHTLTLPNHQHTLEPGMRRHSVMPASFTILVNGVARQTVNAREFQRDITEWLIGSDGRIVRNRYYRIEIRPNAPAWVQMTLSIQGFILSRGGITV